MVVKAIWRLSAKDQAEGIAKGEVSATEATQSSIDRMKEVNGTLNAVVMDLSQQALEQADALDAIRQKGETPGPLHGVPITIKINVDQKGWATTNGLSALKDFIAHSDAPLVKNLKNAGAVVIGRTNTPEFSFRADTDSPLHGRTHNP